MFFCDFRYFLAEIEGPEQKSDSEAEMDCRCCWILTPCTLSGFSGATEAQLARSQRRWKVDILGFPAIYDSPYFAQDLMAQTGVANQLQNSRRLTPELTQKLELNAQTGIKAGV